MSRNTGHERPLKRYVTWRELAAQAMARRQLDDMALERVRTEQATSAPGNRPFLRYVAACGRTGCERCEQASAARGVRAGVMLRARWAVLEARGRI
jgi:hypothetical protein